MKKNWQERFDEMSEINEFYGLPYNDLVDSSIKQFISSAIAQTREETIMEVEEEVRKLRHELGQEESMNKTDIEYFKEGHSECLNEVLDILNKLKK